MEGNQTPQIRTHPGSSLVVAEHVSFEQNYSSNIPYKTFIAFYSFKPANLDELLLELKMQLPLI